VSRVWRVLTWSPTTRMEWPATAFRLLWTVPTVIILLGWADDTVHFDRQVTDDEIQVEDEPDWNSDLRLGDGRCLVIATREYVEC
jgi:hypothetical protein